MTDLFRGLFPPSVLVAEMDPRHASPERLAAEERAQITSAVPKRRLEYAAVRELARPLIAALGLPPDPIPNRADRSPRWPPGVVGSFSHTDGRAVAAVARQDDFAALGCDIEPCCALPDGTERLVATQRERQALLRGEPWHGRLLFSAKEAVYKAQYTLTARIIDFHDLELDFDLHDRTFNAVALVDLGRVPRGYRFTGRYAVAAGLLGTSVTVPHRPWR